MKQNHQKEDDEVWEKPEKPIKLAKKLTPGELVSRVTPPYYYESLDAKPSSIHGPMIHPTVIPVIHDFGPEWSSPLVYQEIFRKMITCEIPQTSGMSHRSWAGAQYLIIRKPTPDVNLGVSFLKPGRWTKYMHDYYEDDPFADFLDSLPSMNRSQIWTYVVSPHRGRHTNGACLVSISYTPSPPIITMVSRATIWAPMGLLDLRFGSLLAHMLGAEFHWFTHQLQVSGMTSIPALINLGMWPLVKSVKSSVTDRILYQYDQIKYKGEFSPFATRKRYFKKLRESERLVAEAKAQHRAVKLPECYPEIPERFMSEAFQTFAQTQRESGKVMVK